MSAPPYSSKAVANYILDLAKEQGEILTAMKLIKLVFIAHGWHLAIAGEPLINEHPEAWKYGPVVPSLYHHFKRFGSGPITKKAHSYRFKRGGGYKILVPSLEGGSKFDLDLAKAIMNFVWQAYSRYSAIRLSMMTHQPNTPWEKVWRRQGSKTRGTDIPDDVIRDHYGALLKNPDGSKAQ